MKQIIAPIYLIIGFIMAILDSLNVIKLGIMSYQTNLCALNGDVNCVSNGISKMILFMFDIILWPIYLAVDFAQLNVVGGVIAVFIIWFFFGRGE